MLNSDSPWVRWGTVVAGLLIGAIIWEIAGLNFNRALMAPIWGNAEHPGAAPRLWELFTDEEFRHAFIGSIKGVLAQWEEPVWDWLLYAMSSKYTDRLCMSAVN